MFDKLKLLAKRFWNDTRAASVGMNDVIIMGVSFFLLAIIGPIAIGEIAGANTTGWESAVITIFQTLLPIIWIIGVAIKYIPRGK